MQLWGALIFGGGLLVFWCWMIVSGPDVISDQKLKMLGIISALLFGFMAYFVIGVAEAQGKPFKSLDMRIRLGSGFLAGAAALWYWTYNPPANTPAKAAEEIRSQVDSAAAADLEANQRGVRNISVPDKTRELVNDLARADEAYLPLRNILDRESVDRGAYRAARQVIAETAQLKPLTLPEGSHLVKVDGEGAIIPLGKWREFAVRAVGPDGKPLKDVRVVWMTPSGGTKAYVGTTDDSGVSKATQLYSFANVGTYQQVAALTRPDAAVGFADGSTIGLIGDPIVFNYQQR